MRIVILGAGPTGLSAAWRLQEHGHHDWMLLESSERPGGLSMSVRDDAGFTWDLGGHVIFSHWKYFDRLLVQALGDQWVEHQREAWVWMRERWIPYPLQNNIWRLPPDELVKCLAGLVEVHRAPNGEPPRTFADWLMRSFGSGLSKGFHHSEFCQSATLANLGSIPLSTTVSGVLLCGSETSPKLSISGHAAATSGSLSRRVIKSS